MAVVTIGSNDLIAFLQRHLHADDDSFLAEEGVTDFDPYRADPSQPLQTDFFVPDDRPAPAGVSLKAKA